MSNSLLDLSSRDQLISNLLSGEKASKEPKETPAAERRTFRVQSDLLGRLEDFLPKIKEANVQLDLKLRKDPKSVDIENVDEESGEQYIEMDLGLGVFDLKKDVEEDDIIIKPSELTAGTAITKPEIVMMDSEEDTDDDEGSESDEDQASTEKSGNDPSTEDEDIVMST
ncbi:hypothetical protein BGZ65_007377 [Modicella reniformis]|uniref:Uncharacterized protein n=1 Tax=Modicella reniformis TaxID=1440133 RepID=A0A9P6ML75_9FUNG|nr:hypothetical protein BGZ65_007377 [Modicella reniformis]